MSLRGMTAAPNSFASTESFNSQSSDQDPYHDRTHELHLVERPQTRTDLMGYLEKQEGLGENQPSAGNVHLGGKGDASSSPTATATSTQGDSLKPTSVGQPTTHTATQLLEQKRYDVRKALQCGTQARQTQGAGAAGVTPAGPRPARAPLGRARRTRAGCREHPNWLAAAIAAVSYSAIAGSAPASSEGIVRSKGGQTLTMGRGVPVCEAYAQRIAQTDFAKMAFCDRPEGTSVPGFGVLERRDLTLDEVVKLFVPVEDYMSGRDAAKAAAAKGITLSRPLEPSNLSDPRGTLRELLQLGWTHAWTYRYPVDIENRGVPEQVILWQGYGVTGEGGYCGLPYSSKPWSFPYIRTRAIILTQDGTALDAEKTTRIFGDPGESLMAGGTTNSNPPNGRSVIPPLASLGIFSYEQRFYIDAVLNPKTQKSATTFVVYLREQGRTKQICVLK